MGDPVSPAARVCSALVSAVLLATHAAAEAWPPLPQRGFISGRVATPADVAAGNAVFSASAGGGATVKSSPLQIQIPQYAYYVQGGTKTQAIVLQAEVVHTQGTGTDMKMTTVGAVLLNGKKVIGLLTSFELLGRAPAK